MLTALVDQHRALLTLKNTFTKYPWDVGLGPSLPLIRGGPVDRSLDRAIVDRALDRGTLDLKRCIEKLRYCENRLCSLRAQRATRSARAERAFGPRSGSFGGGLSDLEAFSTRRIVPPPEDKKMIA